MANKRGPDDDITVSQVSSKSNALPASRSRSTSQSPQSQTHTSDAENNSFRSDASIVLVGIRGTGKSSLAIMASSALGFRVIDADQHFFKVTGYSRAAFNAKHGVKEYRRRELHVMHSILLENQSKCVIICGPGSVEGKGQGLLRDYAKTHPVIYLMRDTDDIQRHLNAWDAKTISHLVEMTAPSYRASSSFEFYNISESRSPDTHETTNSHPSLTLKNLQQDFLRLIYNVTKQPFRRSGPEAGHTISLLPPESKQFTYALSLPLSAMPSINAQLRDMKSTADAVRLIVDSPLVANGQRTFDTSMANNISKCFYLVRRYLQIPVIFQVASAEIQLPTPTQAAEQEEAYFELLRFGLRLAPEYICVDITCNDQRIKDILGARGSTKVIGYFYDAEPGFDGWSGQDRKNKYHHAVELGSDIVWLCQESTSTLDNASLQRFVYDIKASNFPRRPLITYNTGLLGRMSCWQNFTLTPITHSLLRSLHPRSTHNWLLNIKEAQNALYSSFTLDKMYFGVLGSNVSNSLSPAMHNAAYRFSGMPHEYKIFQHSSLSDMEQVFRDHNFGGASITSPFKQSITTFVEFLSQEARAIGAVNTLVPLRQKNLPDSLIDRCRAGPIVAFYGECTDWIGVYNCISSSLSPVNTVQARTTAVVLGAGGMARAVIYALSRLGVRNTFICNRTPKKAADVTQHFTQWWSSEGRITSNNQNSDWDNEIEPADDLTRHSNQSFKVSVLDSILQSWPTNADPPTIVVSALPGCNPIDKTPIDNRVPADWLANKTGGVVVELAYEPLETPLLKQVRAERDRGWIVVDGLQHLLEQGIPQFELFTGRKAPRQPMIAGAIRGYEALQTTDSQNQT